MAETSSETELDWFQTNVPAEDPFLPFRAAFIQSQLRNGHESGNVITWFADAVT